MSIAFKVLTIGDPHFEVKNIDEVEEFLKEIERAVEKINPQLIVVMGDLLHNHEKIHVEALVRAVKLLKYLASKAPTFSLIGNHDRRNNSDFLTDVHPFTALKDTIKNLTIVDKPCIFSLQDDDEKHFSNFIFVPYVPTGRLEEALNTLTLEYQGGWKSEQIDAIFCHQEIRGVQMGPIKSEKGDVWDEKYPTLICGHIHEHHELQPNVIYVGTPYQQNFGESHNKGICLFSFNPAFSIQGSVNLKSVKTYGELFPEISVRAKYLHIGLKIRRKETVTIKTTQVTAFKAKPDWSTKVEIIGTPSELKALHVSGNLKNLVEQGIKYTFKPIEEKTIVRTVEKDHSKKTYLQLFRDLIKEDKELLPYFDNIFSNV